MKCERCDEDIGDLDFTGADGKQICLLCWEAEKSDEWWRIIEHWPHGVGDKR